jgi:hypothetical protein
MRYDLVIIVTCINQNYIHRMLYSLSGNNTELNILVVFINQSGSLLNLNTSNDSVTIKELMHERVSSSSARNIGIRYLLNNNTEFDHIMYPDDDSTFPAEFFSNYKNLIDKNLNYLIDIYCEGTKSLYKSTDFQDGAILYRKDYFAAMSVNMIVNYATFNLVGLLDERLGAGAKYGGGEDIDYFIRCCNHNKNGFIFLKKIYCFHPSPNTRYNDMNLRSLIVRFINYGNGTVFTLCKNKLFAAALRTCFRALGGSAISLFNFKFKLSMAYFVSFFSRSSFLIRSCLNQKYYFENSENSNFSSHE